MAPLKMGSNCGRLFNQKPHTSIDVRLRWCAGSERQQILYITIHVGG
jgi:hypothetical protein